MSKYLDSKKDMHVRVLSILLENKTETEKVGPLKTRVETLESNIEETEKRSKVRKMETSGLTDDKNRQRENLADVAVPLAKGAYVWAKDNKKADLLPHLDIERSDIVNAGVALALDTAGKVLDIANLNASALADYGIEASDIASLAEAIEKLKLASPLPRKQQGQNRVALQEYREKINETDDLLDEIENLVISKFSKSNRSFVNNFLAARRIYDPASRSTQLSITALDTQGKPLEGVYCDLLQVADEEQYTDLMGKALIEGLKSGNYTLDLSLESYKTWSQTISIKRGQKLKLEARLEKA
jgi:hypothetical protein